MGGMFHFVPKADGVNHPGQVADFAEIECIRRADLSVSVKDVWLAMESERPVDLLDEEDEWGEESDNDKVWVAFDEVDARGEDCGEGAFYPFHRRGPDDGQVAVKEGVKSSQRWHALLYLFLLWLTRTSETTIHDARGLFEQLCCDIALNYWGGEKTGGKVVRFGDERAFEEKANDLARELGGGKFQKELLPDGSRPKDARVDIVVHRPFADGRAGRLIGLGQCKSGHNYKDSLGQLNSDAFKRLFSGDGFVVPPARMFFISDRIADKKLMADYCAQAGIVFDRCRIMEYAANVDKELKGKISNWILGRLEEFKVLDRLKAVGIAGARNSAL